MTAADGSLALGASSGWAAKTGGRGGKKRWFEAARPGAVFVVKIPASQQIYLEYYKHHTVPMGAVSVQVDADPPAVVDACCATDCVPAAPGQGIYAQAVCHGMLRGALSCLIHPSLAHLHLTGGNERG
jgi:hypothetical protein